MTRGNAKNRGMIFHLAHLPAKGSVIGQFNDPETDDFIDFLEESKQTHWIINPLTPFGDDLSPYNTSSRFDRNKYFINLNQLATDEYENLLKEEDLPDDIPFDGFTLNMLRSQKDHRFEKAYKNFKKLKKSSELKKEFVEFCEQEGITWLDNNSIHEAIVAKYEYDWRNWPDELKFLPEKTEGKSFEDKIKYLKKLGFKAVDLDIIEQFRFEQFIFTKQFKELKKKLDKKNIKLFVDLAYAISPNGKDVWAKKDIVELDENFQPRRLTGCPPEPVYPFTQRWGQAVWNYEAENFWKYQEDSIRFMLNEGCIRLDHFGGLVNRGAIPTRWRNNGRELVGDEIFKPVDQGGLGAGFWMDEWLEDLTQKRNFKGENLIEMYLRVAEEQGLNPESTFIVEDLGSVCATDTFKNFMNEFGSKLAGLRLPVTYGIDLSINEPKDLYDEFNDSNPYNIAGGIENVALLSGSHDPPALMEVIDTLLDSHDNYFDGKCCNSPVHFKSFCQGELGLDRTLFWDRQLVRKQILRWIYTKPARHAHTTISDALGIYFRPNMPGGWNGSDDKWDMKNTVDGMFKYWSKQFPKGFLKRDEKSGWNPGYKERKEEYVQLMKELYPD